MTDVMTTTESNALKWILLKDYWASWDTHGTQSDNYHALVRFLKALEVEK